MPRPHQLHSPPLLLLVILVVCSTLAASALAMKPPPPPPAAGALGSGPTADTATDPLQVTLRPLLGDRSTGTPGWTTFVVQLKNRTAASIEGHVKLKRVSRTDPHEALITAEFHVQPEQSVMLKLPAPGYTTTAVTATAEDVTGKVLGSAEAPTDSFERPLVFSLDSPSRVAALLRDQPLVGLSDPSTSVSQTARSEQAMLDEASGESILPQRSAGYAPATVVLAKSESLVQLRAPELTALTGWVLAGGTLALAITRPEDLRHETVLRLVGGRPEKAQPPLDMLPDTGPLGAAAFGSTNPGEEPQHSAELKQLKALIAELQSSVGYVGGNLRPSAWGAVASYGLGEVHLLGFEPDKPMSGAVEHWVQQKLLTLLASSWLRQKHVVAQHARTPFEQSDYWLRQSLDPSIGNHWAIVGAALLLLLYALLAGPMNFRVASNSGHPLRALYRLPLWSAGALLLILVLGAVSRGSSTKARHLTLIEAGAGMPRGSAIRFRAFYADSLDDMKISVAETGNVLSLAGSSSDVTAELVAEPQGLAVDEIHTVPWKTTVIREEAFSNIGAGVSLLERDAELWVKNRVGRELLGVVVRDTQGNVYFFERLADGAEAKVSSGQSISFSVTPTGSAYPLMLHNFEYQLDQSSPGLSNGWRAFETLVPSDRNWWPTDVPVLLAQIVGGEGHLTDSGIALESDRTLLRVVGFGGEL